MKTLNISNVTGRLILKEIADQLSAPLIVAQNEILLNLPKDLGSGHLSCTEFPFGISVLELNVLFSEEIQWVCSENTAYRIKFLFNLQNKTHYTDENNLHIELNRLEGLLIGDSSMVSCSYRFPEHSPISVFIILFDRTQYLEKLSHLKLGEQDYLRMFVDAIESKTSLQIKKSLTLQLHDLLNSYRRNNHLGAMRYLFREAKLNEIIYEAFRLFLDATDTDGKVRIQMSVLNSVERATKIIYSEMSQLDDIPTLARRVGTNSNKLQLGFKHQFGCSVKEFIINARLIKATELLESTKLNISEITYEIGIKSKSYFSKIFKARYGMNPNDYKKRTRSA